MGVRGSAGIALHRGHDVSCSATRSTDSSPAASAIGADAEPSRTAFLIVHGKRDQRVPFDQAERLHSAIPESTLLAIGGGNHNLDWGEVGWQEITALGAAFFQAHLQK